MLNLDGAALDMGGREFTYDLPKPFGPDRGPAWLKITAKPAASVNVTFRAALDEVMHRARVMDMQAKKAHEAGGSVDEYVRALTAGAKWAQKAIAELNYDHCVLSWATNVQSGGADLAPTRDNFVALSEFDHPVIAALFLKIQADLSNAEKFAIEAEEAAAEAEVKN